MTKGWKGQGDTLATRFWSKVDQRGPDECWEWTAGRATAGYGRFFVSSAHGPEGAHRVSWELHHGPIPEGMEVCHSCDNPPCVNPAHLFLGTQAVNLADARSKGHSVPPPPRIGAKNNAKLAEADVQAIRERYAAGGVKQSELAAEFGVHLSTIHRAVHRRYWRHVA